MSGVAKWQTLKAPQPHAVPALDQGEEPAAIERVKDAFS